MFGFIINDDDHLHLIRSCQINIKYEIILIKILSQILFCFSRISSFDHLINDDMRNASIELEVQSRFSFVRDSCCSTFEWWWKMKEKMNYCHHHYIYLWLDINRSISHCSYSSNDREEIEQVKAGNIQSNILFFTQIKHFKSFFNRQSNRKWTILSVSKILFIYFSLIQMKLCQRWDRRISHPYKIFSTMIP